MSKDNNIDRLVEDLTPVTTYRHQKRLKLFMVGIIVMLILIAIFYSPFVLPLSRMPLMDLALLLILSIVAGKYAIDSGVPGNNKSAYWVLLPLGIWIAKILISNMEFFPGKIAFIGIECAKKEWLLGSIPLIILLSLVKEGRSTTPLISGMMIALSSAAIGTFAVTMMCPIQHGMHTFLWHFLPLLLLSTIGTLIGRLLIKW